MSPALRDASLRDDAAPPMRICIVGVGPRGLVVLELILSRICATPSRPPTRRPVEVHLVDPHDAGPGAVWRTDQPAHLVMNTVASQVTVFPDPSVELGAPSRSGPTLYEWALSDPAGLPAAARAEASSLGADCYPSRRLYGHYLRWAFGRITDFLPPGVSVHHHREMAVGVGRHGDVERSVLLESGRRLERLDAVVLTLGHGTGARRRAGDRSAERPSRALVHLPPGNPADAPVDKVLPGTEVLLRGLGLNFFDYLTLFTLARGGAFERVGGVLHYRRSGAEPRLLAGSRRGVPHHARGDNRKGAVGRYRPALLTEAFAAALRSEAEHRGRPLDFGSEVWPLVAAEVEAVYYSCLLGWPPLIEPLPGRVRTGDGDDPGHGFRLAYVGAGLPARRRLLGHAGVSPDQFWDWDALSDPLAGIRFRTLSELNVWVARRLRSDVESARRGNVDGPLKAALDVLRDLRNQVRLLLDHGGVGGRSYMYHVRDWYNPLNSFLSVGPPASRVEQLGALVAAGVVRMTGAGTAVTEAEGGGGWLVTSQSVPGWEQRVAALVDCWMPRFDVGDHEGRLVAAMLRDGHCRPHRIRDHDGGAYWTGALDLTPGPPAIVGRNGQADTRVFAFGVPTEGVRWMTSVGVRPWSGSVTITDADLIAEAVLRLAPVAGIQPDLPNAAVEDRSSVASSLGSSCAANSWKGEMVNSWTTAGPSRNA